MLFHVVSQKLKSETKMTEKVNMVMYTKRVEKGRKKIKIYCADFNPPLLKLDNPTKANI
mgnify:CR=1 FL=1